MVQAFRSTRLPELAVKQTPKLSAPVSQKCPTETLVNVYISGPALVVSIYTCSLDERCRPAFERTARIPANTISNMPTAPTALGTS